MDKELENLLDNYENVIYGQAFPINPSIHQLHLLLDYIANLEQQCKKQKEVIDKAVKFITDCVSSPDIYEQFISYPEIKQLLDILKKVSE